MATAFCTGRTHDFKLFARSRTALPPETECLGDSGYQGIAAHHANSRTPTKKSKRRPLTDEQRAENRQLARRRIVAEHVIRSLKVFRILSERYRNRRKRFGLRFNLIAGLYNFELAP